MTETPAKNLYLNSEEIYQVVADYIPSELTTDMEFGKMLYKYMLLDDQMIREERSASCLYDQGSTGIR